MLEPTSQIINNNCESDIPVSVEYERKEWFPKLNLVQRRRNFINKRHHYKTSTFHQSDLKKYYKEIKNAKESY